MNNQLLASDNFASGSLAAGWSAGFGSHLSSVSSGPPYYAQPPDTSTVCDDIWTGLTWPKDQVSELTVQSIINANNTNLALWVRAQSGSLSGYVVNFTIQTGFAFATIYRCDSGSFTQLAQVALTAAPGDIFSFQAAGALLICYQNQKRILWTYDATYTSGSPGFRQNSGTAVADSQVQSWRGYSAVQQDGIWQKQGTVIPALVGDLSASVSAGTYQLSNLMIGTGRLLSGTVLMGLFSGGGSGGSANIYYAESPVADGQNWTRQATPIITGFANPFWIKNGSTYYLYVQAGNAQGGGDIALYTSTDTATWTQQSTTILAPGGSGAWDQVGFFDFQPVAIIGGTWYALYTGGASGGTTLSTGLATSPDGLTWTKYASNPVIVGAVNSGAIAQVGANWYLWAGANQPNQFSGSYSGFRPFEIVRYTSTDLKNWSVSAHSAHRTQMYESLNFNSAGAGGAFPNSIIDVNGKAHLYIQENLADGVTPDVQQISLAIAPASIASIVAQNEDAMPQSQSDLFVRSAGTLGPNWTTPTGFTALQISSSGVIEATVINTACAGIFTGGSFSADQWSEITILTLAGNTLGEPIVRGQVGSSNCYFVNVQGATGNLQSSLQIFKNIGGTSTAIGPAVGFTPQVGDKIRLSVVGNVLSVFQNQFLMIQVQDYSNAIASGSPGMLIFTAVLAQAQISGWAGGNANVIPNYPPVPNPNVALFNSTMGFFIGALAGSRR